ncbi:hypothetical protein [Streptomyces sp. STCH 565 A]|uniref:hypothetical protein n=1 Tax=Streptomyces sp. STCH 565 A TaxID=2950532 RepID=UPI0020763F56|nr:hypothetical protein [Streptomyces sp. STCH 565 A]MCM8548955.1 hypothetical protein [Streptomyces sp. STCH 565 A]
MELITDTYFGWDPLTHTVDCTSPAWDVDVRRTEGIRPESTGADHHACLHPNCEHVDAFRRVQVRAVCRGCDTVRIIGGEAPTEVYSTTALTGWGQAPTQYGGVWLWPGRPAAPGADPHEYLVTLQGSAITRALLYGIVTGYRDSSGSRVWMAGAEPDPDGAHQISALRWRHASNPYPSVAEAAEYLDITARSPHPPVVVTV